MKKERIITFATPPNILRSDAGFNKQLLERAFTLDVGDSIGLYYQDASSIADRRNEDIKRIEKDLWHAEKSGEHYITGSENLQYVIKTTSEQDQDNNPTFIKLCSKPRRKA